MFNRKTKAEIRRLRIKLEEAERALKYAREDREYVARRLASVEKELSQYADQVGKQAANYGIVIRYMAERYNADIALGDVTTLARIIRKKRRQEADTITLENAFPT